MSKDEFIKKVNDLGIELTDEMIIKLDKFYNLLIEWNNKINLTRITDESDVYLKHYYDSLTLFKAINLYKVDSLCDVGTGAGFPGIVLKIVFPNIKITLVDSLQKRVNYLNLIIEQLNLNGIVVYHERGEDFARSNREKFDVVVARAVAELRIISEICIPMVKINGIFIAMKANIDGEIKLGTSSIIKLGGQVKDLIKFDLFNDTGRRTLVVINKKQKSSDIYPRSIEKIKKTSL